MTITTLNFQTAPGYQVLAAAGKNILRSGGRIATEQLFEWANFQPGETVLELASSFGHSAIALAKRYGVRVIGMEKNPESVAKARANINAAGLAGQVEIIETDIFHLEAISEQFDYVLAEAILTMQSPLGMAKILTSIHNRLKPGGKFLSHELSVRNQEEQIHQDLSRVIRVNATPLSEADWIASCSAAALQVQDYQTGSMRLLDLPQLVKDEGIVTCASILWNVLTRPPIRERVFKMRCVFNQYRQDLEYIVLYAVAE